MSGAIVYLFSFGIAGLLWYFMKRYGPVQHNWMNISRQQQRELKRLHRERRATVKSGPFGKTVYSKGLLGHDGLVIYPNGLYGKFGLGKTGRPRFHSFNEIEAIYPTEMEVFNKTYHGLQVEFSDCLVLLINDRVHDMEQVTALLQQYCDWRRLYHEEEMIYGNLKDGYIGLHSCLRRGLSAWTPPGAVARASPDAVARTSSGAVASAPPPGDTSRFPVYHGDERPEPEAAAASQSEVDYPTTSGIVVDTELTLDMEGKDHSKGTLLAVEPPELVDRRCRNTRKMGMIALALTLLPAFFYLRFFGSDIFLYFPLGITLLVGITLLIAFLGFVLVRSANIKKPLRIYANGIEQPMMKDGCYFFVPYGNMVRISEGWNCLIGDCYSLTAKPIQNSVFLTKDFPDVERLIKFIRTRIRKPELQYNVIKPNIRGATDKIEWFEYSLAICFVSFLAWQIMMDTSETWEIRVTMLQLLPSFLIVVIFFMGWHVISLKRRTGAPNGIQLKLVGAILILALIVPFVLALGFGGYLGVAALCFPLNLALVVITLAFLRWRDRKAFPPALDEAWLKSPPG